MIVDAGADGNLVVGEEANGNLNAASAASGLPGVVAVVQDPISQGVMIPGFQNQVPPGLPQAPRLPQVMSPNAGLPAASSGQQPGHAQGAQPNGGAWDEQGPHGRQ